MNQQTFIKKINSCLTSIYTKCPLTYYGIITRAIGRGGGTLLDVGCGNGSLMSVFNRDKSFKVTGVDIFEPYLERAKKTGVYEKLIQADVRDLPFGKKNFDVVFCAHLIEHLTREEGARLIKKLENLARKKVVIIAPVGLLPQDEYDDNPFQEHRSAWYPEDFRKRGYKVVGQGLKLIFGQEDVVKKFGLLSHLFFLSSLVFQPWLLLRPNQAVYMICKKEKVSRL